MPISPRLALSGLFALLCACSPALEGVKSSNNTLGGPRLPSTHRCELERASDADFPFVVVEPGDDGIPPIKRSFLCQNQIVIRECEPGNHVEYGAANGALDSPVKVITGEGSSGYEWRAYFSPKHGLETPDPPLAELWVRCAPGPALE